MHNLAENKRIAIALIESLHEGGDPSLLADDLDWWAPAQGSMDLAQFHANRAKFVHFMKSPSKMTVGTVTAEDDRVAIECTGHGVLKSGTIYQNKYHFLLRITEGKVTSVHEHNDTHYAAGIFKEILGGS